MAGTRGKAPITVEPPGQYRIERTFMLRKIVDYKKLDNALSRLLVETYPNGYGDDDIIAFRNLKGEIVEAVELRTDEILYLVKISKSLAKFISNFEDSIDKDLHTEQSTDPVLEQARTEEAMFGDEEDPGDPVHPD